MDICMYLSYLSLKDFRNYKQLDLPLESGLLLFQGENAQGKTNLLEAVAMLATSNSFHAGSDREVINWDAQDHLARVSAGVKREEDEVKIEIVVIDPAYYGRPQGAAPAQQNMHRQIELPASAQRKRIKVNGVPK